MSNLKHRLNRQEDQMASGNSGCALNNLPTEILLEVFAHYISAKPSYLPWRDNYNRKMVCARYSNPFSLCRVCTLWRDVVTGEPSLWSKIHIRAPLVGDCTKESLTLISDVAKLQAQTARAGNDVPLSLYLDLSAQPNFLRTGISLSAFVRGQLDALNKVRRLYVRGNAKEGASPGLEQSSFPNLEFLFLDGVGIATGLGKATRSQQGALLIPTFPCFPALKRLAGNPIQLSHLPHSIPWHKLTHLHLESPLTPDEIIGVLNSTPKLRIAGLKRCTDGNLRFLPSTLKKPNAGATILMADLQRLAFVGALFDRVKDYEKQGIHLSWPNLTHLRLMPEDTAPSLYPGAVLSQQISQLTHLSISDSNRHHLSQLAHIFQFCPLLVHLGIGVYWCAANHRELFEYLTFDRDAPRLPLLKELGVYISIENHICWSAVSGLKEKTLASLRAMAESRDGTQDVPAALNALVVSVGGIQQYQRASLAYDGIGEVLRSLRRRPALCRVVREKGVVQNPSLDFDSTFDGAFEDWRGSRISDIIDNFEAF
ncbi:hypothetical protein NMY22_g11752 [Coprinellus aureogranulatus]|nr:hypothetical protein NMY22_g11752 [Coprinellus aureogranulatus]